MVYYVKGLWCLCKAILLKIHYVRDFNMKPNTSMSSSGFEITQGHGKSSLAYER